MDINEIYDYFKRLVDDDTARSKMQLAIIYGAYEREQTEEEKNGVLIEILGTKDFYIIHRISDDMAIIEYPKDIFKDGKNKWYKPVYKDNPLNSMYESFDIALIALIAYKANDIHATDYIVRMLGIE